MITKTSKQAMIKIVDKAIERLNSETFIQFQMIGIDWLFISTNDSTYATLTTDKLRGQIITSVFNKHSGQEQKEYYNVTRPTMQAIDGLLASKQDVYVYG